VVDGEVALRRGLVQGKEVMRIATKGILVVLGVDAFDGVDGEGWMDVMKRVRRKRELRKGGRMYLCMTTEVSPKGKGKAKEGSVVRE
jgi:hypothetical protein